MTTSDAINGLRRPGFISICLLAALLTASASGTVNGQSPEAQEWTHGFELSDLEGQMRSSDEWNGKALLVNFWATWCAPCLKEMPVLMGLHEKYEGQDFEVVGLAAELGAAADDPEKVANFIRETGIEYPILFGEMEAVIDISKRYGNQIGGLPYSAFIDRNGVVRHVRFGEMSLAEAERMLQDIL